MPLDQMEVEPRDPKRRSLSKTEKEMSFFEHLEELRWHIIRSLSAVMIMTVVLFLAKDFIFNTVLYGPKQPDFFTYRVMCRLSEVLHMESICIRPRPFKFIATDIGANFFAHFQLAFFLAVALSFPYMFYEIWRFVSPGLMDKERKAARGIVLICSTLFLIGVSFGYYVIAPFAISFLAGYDVPDVEIMPTISSYIGYMIMFTMPIGLVFELPVVIYFLSRVGLVTPSLMREYRKHVLVVILIVAGVITPSPDVMSQLLVAVPLYMLYEASVIVSARVVKKLKEEEGRVKN